MFEIHWTEIDGVTTVWVDAPPPLWAGLLFRTGRIDETLATSGHTHLIEHLAFSTHDITDQNCNGQVDAVDTSFWVTGRMEDLTRFLERICRSLSELPRDRLEAEKRILAAEGSGRSFNNVYNTLLVWRYGAVGYGLFSHAELGIPGVTYEQLSDEVAQRFTKENAILWLSGPPPSNLRLELPHGNKRPLPSLEPIQKEFPAFFVDDGSGGAAVGATVPRVSASQIFVVLARNRLQRRLRTDHALSYAPSVAYGPLNADIAHLSVYADSHGEHRKELAKEFGEVFEGFDEIDEQEIESARNTIVESWTGHLAPVPRDQMLGEVQRAASDWILGKEHESRESLLEGLAAVTKDDVLAFIGEMKATAMFALPGEAILQPCFGERVPVSIVPAVYGEVAPSIDAPINQLRLVSGSTGVSLLFSDGVHRTVRYSDLAAAIYYEDGGVYLIGLDATQIMVEPTLWHRGQRVCQEIRARIPEHMVVETRSRPAEEIPQPQTTGWQRFFARFTMR